jgi:hypothetical protein
MSFLLTSGHNKWNERMERGAESFDMCNFIELLSIEPVTSYIHSPFDTGSFILASKSSKFAHFDPFILP